MSECTGLGGKDCGQGIQTQRRECRRERGGQLCQLDGREVVYRNESCFLKPCPGKYKTIFHSLQISQILPELRKTFLGERMSNTSLDLDCVYELSPCSVTCGGAGWRRVNITTKPRGRGSSCPTTSELQCFTAPCPAGRSDRVRKKR